MILQEKIKRRISKRKKSIKHKLASSDRPRLCVYKSNTGIYVQIIDDSKGHTLVSASNIDKEVRKLITPEMKKTEVSKIVGKAVAERALAQNIDKVVFDRNGNIYVGRIKVLAEAVREAGLRC